MPPARSRVVRWLFVGLGMLCVALAAAGAFLPGLPTTVWLLLASFFFTRSCPWLERKLLRNRLFGPYLRYIDGSTRMPLRARVGTVAIVWVSIALSGVLLWHTAPHWLIPLLAASGLAATWCIAWGVDLLCKPDTRPVSD